MNKETLIQKGLALMSTDIEKLVGGYEEWKEEVLQFVGDKDSRIVLSLHVVNTPYGTREERKEKYQSCIQKVIKVLSEKSESKTDKADALESVLDNFGLYLKNMFLAEPENKATLKPEILQQIHIENEYDVQHIMYAVIKALYPSARREVSQDTGYGTVRYDIVIEEIDTVIELKCTRKDHTDSKLCRELGEDGYFYKCSKLLIYVYDKHKTIADVGNFVKALERTKETAGKEVKVFVEQVRDLI
jgi:hypothetical protein